MWFGSGGFAWKCLQEGVQILKAPRVSSLRGGSSLSRLKSLFVAVCLPLPQDGYGLFDIRAGPFSMPFVTIPCELDDFGWFEAGVGQALST